MSVWSNDHVDLYSGGQRGEDLVIDGSGRRDRYIREGCGNRAPCPWLDRENSPFEGEEDDPDMRYIDSGRRMVRSKYEAENLM